VKRILKWAGIVFGVLVLFAVSAVIGFYGYQVRGWGIPTEDVPPATVDVGDTTYRAAWEFDPYMPTPRLEMCSAVYDGKIYVMGGIDGVARTTRITQIYDTEAEQWSDGPTMPEPRHHAQAVTLDGMIYVIGGYSDIDFTPAAEMFRLNPRSGEWKEVAPMPTPRGAMGAVAHDGKIYVVGGASDKAVFGLMEVYDPETDSWSEAPSMPTKREHFAYALGDGKLFVAGGRVRSIDSNMDALDVYDFQAEEWSSAAPMPGPRGGCTGGFAAGLFIVTGGEEPGGTRDTVEGYNHETNKWITLPNLPTTRHSHNTIAHTNSVYVIGGGKRVSYSISGYNEQLIFTPTD